MEPNIPPGSVVVGVRGDPGIGSVVVFDRGGRLVVHRVVHANSTHVVTRGDACVEDDPPTPVEDVLCVVVFHVRGEAVALAAVAAIGGWYLAKNLRKRD
ncbi:MAG: S24/S26 family peptidase [Desulfurococcaceae archaeon]